MPDEDTRSLPQTVVADEGSSSFGRIDYVLAAVSGLIGLAMMIPVVLATRPGYLCCTDCVPYVVQAHIFSTGRLTRPAPPEELSRFLDTVGMLKREGREFSRQPPGASTMLALLMSVVRDIRLGPVVMSALAIALTYLWVRRAYGLRIAVTAVYICLLSPPAYKVVCCSVLSYVPSSMFLAAGMLMLVLALSRRSTIAALACGLLIGLQFTVRPFTASLVSMTMMIIILGVFRQRPKRLSLAVGLAAGLGVGVILLLVHNRLITQTWWPLAFAQYEPKDRLGFGLRGLGPVPVNHTPRLAVRNLATTFHEMAMVFLWFYVVLIPVLVWWAGRLIRHRRSGRGRLMRWDFSLILLIASIIGGHMLYWCPRSINYSETYPLFAVLASRGVWYVVGNWRPRRRLVVVSATVLLTFVALLTPLWMYREAEHSMRPMHQEIERYHSTLGKLLVFVAGRNKLGEDLEAQHGEDFIMPGLFNCSMSPEQPVIYAADRGPENARLIARYPDRHPCVLRGTELTSLDESGRPSGE